MKFNQSGARLGFSLAEVTLALGIASIALLSVVGLLSLAMDTSGTAGQDTALTTMAGFVTGDLHVAPFDQLGRPFPTLPMGEDETMPATLADSIYYFTQEGVPLPKTATATSTEAHFECVVKKSVDESFRSVGGISNMVQVQLNFTWPVSTSPDPAKRPEKSTFHASIARY